MESKAKLSQVALFFFIGFVLFGIFIYWTISSHGFVPQVRVDLEQNRVDLNGNFKDGTYSELVTASIIREDDKNISTTFVLKFPDESAEFYPVDVDGKRLTSMSSNELRGKGTKHPFQFKVFVPKGDASPAGYKLRMEFWWNNTKLSVEKVLDVHITRRQ